MSDLYKTRIWCETESSWVEGWADHVLDTCPNNNTHTIDALKSIIVDSILEDPPKDRSGKLRVHETSRALGTKTYFAGAGDNTSDITDVGNGTKFTIEHGIGDPNPQSIYLDFNIIENETWIHEGYIQWKDALFDRIDLSVVPRTVSCHIDSTASTDFVLLGGYLVVPIYTVGGGPGDGNLVIDSDYTDPSDGLIYMPNDDLNELPTAFWNADWNSSTKRFENLTPAPTGNGRYNMFSVEVPFARFANKIPLLGNGFLRMQTADTDQIGQGMRFKMTAYTQGDHQWSISFIMTMHREHTA